MTDHHADQPGIDAAFPRGSWPSPITLDMPTRSSVRLTEPGIDGAHVYWIESRAGEGGRGMLVRLHSTIAAMDAKERHCNAL